MSSVGDWCAYAGNRLEKHFSQNLPTQNVSERVGLNPLSATCLSVTLTLLLGLFVLQFPHS